MSYKPRSLFRMIEEVNQSLFLPHIQRPFVWDRDQMRRLFDSLMRNYPIQTFLFWRTKDEIKARRFMTSIEWDPDLSDYYDKQKSAKGIEKVFVLDGQQRLQTLYTIFAGTVKGETDAGDEEAYVDVTGGEQPDEDGLVYQIKFEHTLPGLGWYRIRDLTTQHQQRNAEEIAEGVNETLAAALKDEGTDAAKAREKRVRRNVSQMVSLLREERHFWVEELDGVADKYPYSVILDIFVRVNSGGTKLDAGDLMFAVMKEEWAEIEEKVEDVVGMLNEPRLAFTKDFVLKCLVVAHGQGAELKPEKFSSTEGEKLLKSIEQDWPRAEEVFKQLRDFIKNELRLVSDAVVRSYGSFVPLVDFLFHNPQPNEVNRRLMAAYYYKAQLFNWYRARTDNLIDAMHRIVGKDLKGRFPIEEVKSYFGRGNVPVELADQHLLESRLRFILLNLLYVEVAGGSAFDVLYKGNLPHVDHIYPQSGLRKDFGLSTPEVNHLGNYRLVGATDNIRKRAEKPAAFFGRLKKAQVPVERHLLLKDVSDDPALLKWDAQAYRTFRDRRLAAIFEICRRVVNAEDSRV
jgi:hypothetical protein